MKILARILATAACFAATPAMASTTIDFEGYTPGYQSNPIVDSGATFSSPEGLYISDFLFDGNLQVCSTEGATCAIPLSVDFATAVSSLSFLASGDDSASTLSVLLTLQNLSTTLATFTMDGDIFTYETIDLSSYGNILGIAISTDDSFGLSYDDFTFSEAVTATPEPATWLMLLLGFGLMGSALRRRRQAGPALA